MRFKRCVFLVLFPLLVFLCGFGSAVHAASGQASSTAVTSSQEETSQTVSEDAPPAPYPADASVAGTYPVLYIAGAVGLILVCLGGLYLLNHF